MTGNSLYGYQLLRLLGAGGMADIYYAENSLGKPAAVKILKLKYSDEQMVHDRFISEAKTTVKLHHPNIREVYDLGEIEGQPGILMEYLEGHSLLEVLREEGELDDNKVLDWFQQTVTGLQYAHKQGVIHRDIKPSNLFLTNEGKIKILDFGIAKVKENITMTQTGQTLGTLTYMSPEQVMDPKRVDERTDIYSLGVTFYHLLTGKMPYDITTDSGYVIQRKIVEEKLELKNLTEAWKERLGVCLSKDARGRSWEAVMDVNDMFRMTTIPRSTMDKGEDEETVVLKQKNSINIEPKKKNWSTLWSRIRPKTLYLTLLVLILLMVWGVWEALPNHTASLELKPYYDPDLKLWGVKKGEDIIVKPEYHYIHPFSEGMAAVEISGKFGFVDSIGRETVPIKYDFVDSFSNGRAKIRRDGRFGFIDQTGNEVILAKYWDAKSFSDGLSAVQLKREWGFIDKNGIEVISIGYEEVGSFNGGKSRVKKSGKWGLIDKNGDIIIPFIFDDLNFSVEGLALAKFNGKYGFLNKNIGEGKLKEFWQGYGGEKVGSFQSFLKAIITSKEIRGEIYKSSRNKNSIDFRSFEVEIGFAVPFKYQDASSFSNGLARVNKGGKWGFVDETGQEIISFKYDWADSFSEGLVRVEIDDHWGFIDKMGKEIISLKYDGVWDFMEGLAGVEIDGKWGFIDKMGKEVIPLKYDKIRGLGLYEGMVAVGLNGKCGFIDKKGQEVISLKYDNVWNFSEGLAGVEFDGQYGFIDKTGQEIISLKYDNVLSFSEGLAGVKLGGQWGFIDRMDQKIIPLEYDWVGRFSKGLSCILLNSNYAYIDKNGEFGYSPGLIPFPSAFISLGWNE